MYESEAAIQMQAKLASLIDSAKGNSSIGKLLRREGVAEDDEFERIDLLPRREYKEEQTTRLVEGLTAQLKTSLGTQELRPHQAIGLYEAFALGGLFCPLRAGGGKTLISFLLSRCMGENLRVLILVPAKLVKKTMREMQAAALHWDFPLHMIRVESYELLGRKQSAGLLEAYRPGVIIADECHKLRNKSAAVTKRIHRYGSKYSPAFVAMSGTITKRSLKDYAHIIEWCLGVYSPLPTRWRTLEQWASAADEKTGEFSRFAPGALLNWVTQEDWIDRHGEPHTDELKAVRKALGRRLRESVGWVQAKENKLGVSLVIDHVEVTPCEYTLKLFEHVNKNWTTPDNWPIADGLTFYRHRREVAQGFYYKWDPYPPEWWVDPRQAWSAECRQILKHNRRGLDSEAMVALAVLDGHYRGPALTSDGSEGSPSALDLLERWQHVREHFELKTVPVWFSHFMLDQAAAWMANNVGIVWVEHIAVGIRLAQMTGVPYYGSGGTDAKTGRQIESEDGSRPIIASVESNFEGRNLQMFCRNFITSQPPNGPQNEQLYARTHRDGQEEDEVTVTVAISCIEHAISYYRSRDDSEYAEDTLAQDQRLLYANNLIPPLDTFASRDGANWARN